jgi:hypothetical protein
MIWALAAFNVASRTSQREACWRSAAVSLSTLLPMAVSPRLVPWAIKVASSVR